ncbi:hypothetical protein [Streptomyces griseoloalbus]|uniref:Uncharacterized protein n=1 Tax=Streptomyces griseoloalbus TaxID=67303 RepID=A0A7W8BVG6_9ACTN|nr:hypothetical protein [Streptomyces albaduncus]MBB5130230.1 hypothetical protein [Streptomyces albaduncus]GGV87477.1 hypothetical protein GCM10010294_69430 [Streptomyces griseoloalbus]GGW81419.1 hypothetical protein GCM10010340_69400 [Streptomyces albaduncus]
MYRKLETLGTRLLGLLVPKVDASAACGPEKLVEYGSCWQCDYRPCLAVCRDNCGCQVIGCG